MNNRQAILITEKSVLEGLLQDAETKESIDLSAEAGASNNRIFSAKLAMLKQATARQHKQGLKPGR